MPSRWKIVAVTAGIILAGVPMAAFNVWIDRLTERQGQDEAEQWARRSVAIAEKRIDSVIAKLRDLSARGVNSCSEGDIAALRRATFATNAIKELAVLGPDGEMLCNDLGLSLGTRSVTGSHPLSDSGRIFLDVVRVSIRPDLLVRIRRQSPGETGLAALVPSELFMSVVSGKGVVMPARMRTTLMDGTLVGENQTMVEQGGLAGPYFTGTQYSSRFGLVTTVSLPRSAIEDEALRKLGVVVTGIAALVIAAFALLWSSRQRRNPAADLERALKAGELIAYYQPIINLASGRLHGAEVLVRWRKADGSIVSPSEFIPLAESSGLIVEMTRHIMCVVRDELQATYARRPHLRIAFNLAAQHFSDDRLVADICQIFERSPIRYSQLILELTERQPVENLTAARGVIASVQQLGVKVAVDDMGSGHAGLSYMLKLGVDVIKIDKDFINAVGTGGNSMRILETLVDLANNMRMEIIAEGVENSEQAIALRNYGVRLAQGYAFAPPLPGPLFLKLVETIEPAIVAPQEKLDAAA